MDISNIKLIIWDLDDTFWRGTLSEGEVEPIQKCIDLVVLCAKKGVVSAICSKNDLEPCKKRLTELDVWDYFVFPSINWEPKGQRIKSLISDMNLRPANALFLDDNHLNLEEAKFYCPDLMTALPDITDELYDAFLSLDKNDAGLERLNRYKVLETKQREKTAIGSNEEFLMQSDIHVDVHTDCLAKIDRIHELILRSNQLNFTKLRSSRDELELLLNDPDVNSGYVTAHDKYGEYGVIGFFVYRGDKMIHFLFSCRTLGMGIEQYVYERIGFPEMTVEGSVSAQVGREEPRVTWINRSKSGQNGLKPAEKGSKNDQNGLVFNENLKILIKGPCDLSQIFSFIQNEELFDCEFTYASEEKHSLGVSIEGVNHTTQIVQAKTLTEAEKAEVCALPFCDGAMYPTSIYDNAYGMIFLSILTDANLGMYKKIGGDQVIAFGEWLYPLTDKANWDGYINSTLYTGNCRFTREFLEKFSSEYEFAGRITPEETVENLKFIRENTADGAELVIMLGCETEFKGNSRKAWVDRHIEHKAFNDAVREFAKGCDNVTLFDVNGYVKSQDDFSDSINHYKKRIYYLMAQKFIEMINARSATELKNPSKLKLAYLSLRQRIKEILIKKA